MVDFHIKLVSIIYSQQLRNEGTRLESIMHDALSSFLEVLSLHWPRRGGYNLKSAEGLHATLSIIRKASQVHFSTATMADGVEKEATTRTSDTSGAIKLATYKDVQGRLVVGCVRHDKIWPLSSCLDQHDGAPEMDMVAVIKSWPSIVDRLRLSGKGIAVSDVDLQAPIPRPTGTIMCIGKNYLEHVREVDTWKTAPGISQPSVPQHPIVFTKSSQSVVGPGAVIKYPHGVSKQVDYEAEIAVIIGKEGRSISRESAMDYVFGYTILNDVTARDLQKQHQQWFLGKSLDTFCPMGPWILPATATDEKSMHIRCWVNDELRQDGNMTQLIFSVPELIWTISAGITLQPGDIIATGTPAGMYIACPIIFELLEG
eukprot:jgi/Mesen1/4025/ME000212S03051